MTDGATPPSTTRVRAASLTSRYVLALVILALLTVGGLVVRELVLAEQRDNTRIINVAGRQRMLSQRIAKEMLRTAAAADATTPDAADADLRHALDAWRNGRRSLLEGDPARNIHAIHDPALRARLEALGPLVERLQHAAEARDVAAYLHDEAAYLQEMDAITFALVELFQRQHRALITADRLRVLLVLLTIVALAAFVLRPAVRAIESTATELEDKNAALDAALQQAHSLATMKDDFLAMTSHELRTPLNAVIGLSGLLKTTALDTKQRQFVDTINTSGEGLLQLINDLLDLSKMDAGKLELEEMDVELRDVIESAVESLALRAEAKGVDLGIVVAPETPDVIRGDAGRLGQVLLNLLSNALKFTDSGSVMVRVTVVPDADAPMIRCEVEDTGIGISEAAQARLFQPFHQADSSTTRRYGGTGLGLSVARRLIELMHGTIGVRSTLGSGSVFWFEIPVRAPLGSAVVEPLDTTLVAGMKVLVVDDIAANRLVLTSLLHTWRMIPVEADSAERARIVLGQHAADRDLIPLAIIDWQMPDADGHELAAAIRVDPVLRGMKLIQLSSFSRGRDESGATAAGFDYALAKPVRHRPLWRAIHTVLGTVGKPFAPEGISVLPQFADVRVLVVDDNPVNTLVLRAMLEPMGINVDVAANGVEAVQAMERMHGAYHLILMDVQMPELDGREATRLIRERFKDAPHYVPIVAVTAAAMPDDQALCLESGMNDYVTKPIPIETLVATVKRWIPQ